MAESWPVCIPVETLPFLGAVGPDYAAIFIFLCSRAAGDGVVSATAEEISRGTGIALRTLTRLLRCHMGRTGPVSRLFERVELVYEGKHRQGSRWQITDPPALATIHAARTGTGNGADHTTDQAPTAPVKTRRPRKPRGHPQEAPETAPGAPQEAQAVEGAPQDAPAAPGGNGEAKALTLARALEILEQGAPSRFVIGPPGSFNRRWVGPIWKAIKERWPNPEQWETLAKWLEGGGLGYVREKFTPAWVANDRFDAAMISALDDAKQGKLGMAYHGRRQPASPCGQQLTDDERAAGVYYDAQGRRRLRSVESAF